MPERHPVIVTGRAIGAAALVLAVAACSDGDGGATSSTPAGAERVSIDDADLGAELPPNDELLLRSALDPVLAGTGQRATRVGLYDFQSFELRDDGDHLAVYLAPNGDEDWDDDRYLETFPQTISALVPLVFDRWPGLNSIDVCQELLGTDDDPPPNRTLLVLTRADVEGVDWPSLDLVDLRRLQNRSPASVRLEVDRELASTDEWLDAELEARDRPLPPVTS